MKKRRYLFALAFLLFFGVGILTFVFFGKAIHDRLFPSKAIVAAPGGIAMKEKVEKCRPGDATCESNNQRIMANNVPGDAATYARHQCDGPRACPTPDQAQSDEAISAIRAFTKDKKVELVRITGINAVGMVYYCANDARCWSYTMKDKKVVLFEQGEAKIKESVTISP